MPPLRAGVKTGTLSVQVDLPNPPPRGQRGQYTGPRAQSTGFEPGLHPVLATPPWRAHDPRGSQRRKLRLAGGETRPRSGTVGEPRGRARTRGQGHDGGGDPTRAEAPRGGGGRVTLSCCVRRVAPASAPDSPASCARAGSAPGRDGAAAPPAPRAHFLVSASSSLLLALRRPALLPSLSRALLLPSLSQPLSSRLRAQRTLSPFALLPPRGLCPPRSPTFS